MGVGADLLGPYYYFQVTGSPLSFSLITDFQTLLCLEFGSHVRFLLITFEFKLKVEASSKWTTRGNKLWSMK